MLIFLIKIYLVQHATDQKIYKKVMKNILINQSFFLIKTIQVAY